MPDVRIGTLGFFDHGLDDITDATDTAYPGLPTQSMLAPAELRPQALAQLLTLPDIAAFLEEAVRPDIDDREQLAPERFRQTLAATLDALGELADTLQATDPGGAKLVNRAARVLREDTTLRELLQMYRSAVHQG